MDNPSDLFSLKKHMRKSSLPLPWKKLFFTCSMDEIISLPHVDRDGNLIDSNVSASNRQKQLFPIYEKFVSEMFINEKELDRFINLEYRQMAKEFSKYVLIYERREKIRKVYK